MASLEETVREAQGENISLRLKNSHGNTLVANYIGVGELNTGGLEAVVGARVDFKGFTSLNGQDDWSIRHHGGVLVDGLAAGHYSSENGELALGTAEIIPAAELRRLVTWLKKLDRVVVLVPHHRARLSPLAV